jgi:hypothetical protein
MMQKASVSPIRRNLEHTTFINNVFASNGIESVHPREDLFLLMSYGSWVISLVT